MRFNWPMIVSGALFGISALAIARMMSPGKLRSLTRIAGAGACWQTAVSLAATHAAYDRSELHDWTWLSALLPRTPATIANVHSGFDESSEALRALFPQAQLRIFDFFDPVHQTEPSIARARRLCATRSAAESIAADSLPLLDGSQDLIMFFLAAHEIRERSGRTKLLREAARGIAHDGRVVIVEHLRDLPNFIAYGPGAFHFHSRHEWVTSIRKSGLRICRERRITPFIRVFTCCRCS